MKGPLYNCIHFVVCLERDVHIQVLVHIVQRYCFSVYQNGLPDWLMRHHSSVSNSHLSLLKGCCS